MIVASTAAVLLLVSSIGFAIGFVRRSWGPRRRPAEGAFTACAGALLGLGIASTLTTLRLVALASGWARDAWWDLVASIALTLATISLRERVPRASPRDAVRIPWFLVTIFIVTAVLFVIVHLEHALRSPDGAWDAWAIWNYRARTLFRTQGSLSAASVGYDPGLLSGLHLDYPLLLPSLVFRLWTVASKETAMVPALIGFVFGAAIIGIVASAIAVQIGTGYGLVAGLVLAATPALLQYSSWQVADVPVSAFVTLALACMAMALLRDGTTRAHLLAVAGAASACAACTKNEGAVHGLALLAAILVTGFARNRPFRERLRDGAACAVGAAPFVAVLFLYRHVNAIDSQQVSSAIGVTLNRLATRARYVMVLRYLWKAALDIRQWGVLLIALMIGLPLALRSRDLAPVWAIAVAVAFSLCGFVFAYVTSPYDLQWQLETSLDRLLIQIVPAGLLGCTLGLREGGRAIEDPASAFTVPPTSAGDGRESARMWNP